MNLSRLARRCRECPGTARPALQDAGPGLVCDECGEAWELVRLPIGHQILLSEWAEQQAARPLVVERTNKSNSSSRERGAYSKRFWLKAHHIELLSLVQSQRKSAEQRDSEGRLVQVIWHHPKSEAAQRFRSTLELRQHRKNEERRPKIVWVKEDEIAAAADALRLGRTIELGPSGERGRVEFYPEDSAMAKKYLAQICVIRQIR